MFFHLANYHLILHCRKNLKLAALVARFQFVKATLLLTLLA